MRRVMASLLLLALVWMGAIWPPGVSAQGTQPGAQSFTLVTPFPSQEVGLGETVTIPLTLRAKTTAQIIHFSLKDLPTGWDATFRGESHVIEAAFVQTDKDTAVDLQVVPPKDVASNTYKFTVVASSTSDQAMLPIELTVKAKLPPGLNLSVDLPTLQGSPTTTFRYDATLKNEGDTDLSVTLLADAPHSLQVDFMLNSQSVTNVPLAANESKTISVEAKPFSDIAAGDYPFKVTARAGNTEASVDLTATVTGQPDLAVTAPDDRLSGQAYAGSATSLKLVVSNTGSAPARNIQLSGTPPAGWKLAFSPAQIDELPSGQQQEVTASLQPSAQAVPGDYMVTLHANSQDGPSKDADFRITVLTSTIWGLVGIALIAVAVLVVGLAVARFGRR